MKIGVSTCLLGCPVRYDGRDKFAADVAALREKHELVPVCPETECGLGVPREPMSLIDGRLVGNIHGKDFTPLMLGWIGRKLDELAGQNLEVFIFKSKSPSCGDGGLFKKAFIKRFPSCRVLDENSLEELRELL